MAIDDPERGQREEIVVGDYGGILPYFEALYIRSIRNIASRALMAFDEFDSTAGHSGDTDSFASLSEAILLGGALSRYFWPTSRAGRLGQARGQKLREAFMLNESSALNDRDLRNFMEHFDEKLDSFLLNDRPGIYFPDPIVGSSKLDNDEVANIFMLADPTAGECIMLGHRFSFRSIQDAVLDVFLSCDSKTSGRL